MPTSINDNENVTITSCKDDENCELRSCDVCLQEIPESAVLTAEGEDYVHHFCGLDCLAKWKMQNH